MSPNQSQRFVYSCLLYMNKTCTECNQSKNLNDFAKRGDRTQYRCKTCMKRQMRKHYDDNKELYIQRAQIAIQQLRTEINSLKESKPCTDCKISYPFYKMSFDHLDSRSKVGEVSSLILYNNRKVLYDEIAKCELVCLNCHAERTHKRNL